MLGLLQLLVHTPIALCCCTFRLRTLELASAVRSSEHCFEAAIHHLLQTLPLWHVSLRALSTVVVTASPLAAAMSGDAAAVLRRADSLPPLEAVPSPTHSNHASVAAAAVSVEPSTVTASVPALQNELPRTFSGDILHTLEHLGVSAYSTADVEQTVIARAMQLEEDTKARQQAKQAALHARRRPADASHSQQRKRIPKKIGTSIAAASLLPHTRVVHEDDPVTAAGTLSKQRLEDALSIRQQKDRPRHTPHATASNRESSEAERKEAEEGEVDTAPSVRTATQRMIDQGELTPFHSMPGVEKDFRRVSRAQLPTPSPTAATAARPRSAAPPPLRTSLPPPKRSERKTAAVRSKPPPRSFTPTLRPPTTSRRQRGSVTPPPVLHDSKSPVSSDSSVVSAWSASELPRRLTRAQMRQEEQSLEEAMRRSEREASGVKEERKQQEDDVQLIEEDSVKEESEEGGDEADDGRGDDGEWKGDAESSSSEAEEADEYEEDADGRSRKRPRGSAARPGAARRRLIKPTDVEAEEVAEVEDEQLLDDDNDDDDAVEAYTGAASSSRRRTIIVDDFFDWQYEERVAAYRDSKQFVNEVRRVEGRAQESKEDEGDDSSLDVAFDGGYVLPGRIWDRLFGYQKTSVKWMWELHCQNVGGIIADEMGLGKTIQMVAFLAGLHYSNAIHTAKHGTATPSPFLLPPTLILAPATIMTQWLRELHSWYPELRVLVLHDSVQAHHGQSKETVLARLFQSAHVLITTYECCRIYQHLLLGREWGYVSPYP